MKTRNKVLGLMLAAGLLVTATIFGTMAYLTSTDEVNNTFTVGNVKITLDEAEVNPDGTLKVDHDLRVEKNNYKLMPGHSYKKDPTVTVKAGSEKSYVRALVTVNKVAALKDLCLSAFGLNEFNPTSFVKGYDPTKWKLSGNPVEIDDTITYELRYTQTVQALDDNDVILPDLFESFIVPGETTNAQLAALRGLKIDVVAQAVQADGFNSADAAWAESFDNQD